MMEHNASSCERDHLINIINFGSNETVQYPVIVIKGTIRNTGSCKAKLQIEHQTQDLIRKSNWTVHNSQFKSIIELLPHNNTINLSYCNSSTTFSIVYKESNSSNTVVPVLIICKGHNGEINSPDNYPKSIESSCERLILAIRLMQSYFGEKFKENGLNCKTFNTQLENNLPQCIIHESKLHIDEARKMTECELWQYFGREIMTSVHNSKNRKFLAFLTSSVFKGCEDKFLYYDSVKNNTDCYACIGKGNFALIGSAFFYTWPQNLREISGRFQDTTPETFVTGEHQAEPLINSIGGCYTVTFGAAIHELAHLFDLGHTQYGLMGREYINIDKIFSFGRYDFNPQAPYNLSKKNDQVALTNHKTGKTSCTVINKPLNSPTLKMPSFAHLDQYSAQILFHHKWFNNHIITHDQNISLFVYDNSLHKLKTINNLIIVQLRHMMDELVECNTKFHGQTYEWVMDKKYYNKTWYLFAIDGLGNVFKCVTHNS